MKHSVSEHKLKNGAKGLFIHVPGASVMAFEINFRAGDFLAPSAKWEVAHIMEHMLLGANEMVPRSRAFQAEFEKNGAYCNASTGSYDVTYEAECADFEWERIAELLRMAITKPLFLDDEFKAEHGNVREELTGRSNNHFRHLSLALRNSYGYKVLTDQERLKRMKNVTVEDVRKHYTKTHFSKNMRFVIAGNITPAREERLLDLLNNFELPPGDKRFALPAEKPHGLRDPLYINNRSVDNIHFYFDTFLSRRLKEQESDALSMVNTMLTETLHSRILGEARERGLVYGMSSNFLQTKSAVNWWFGTQVTPENAPALFTIISKELQAICEGDISSQDLAAAQQYLLGKFQRSGQTVFGVASGYSNRYFFDDHIEDHYAIPSRIKAVTKEQIVDLTNEFFSRPQWGIGFLGNVPLGLRTQLVEILKPVWRSS
jgi:predicted Zn-dependent peptidase